jgi:hypothetical protein
MSENKHPELIYEIMNPENNDNWPNIDENGIHVPREPYYIIPPEETIYNINLDTREIEVPEFLSVTNDHNAETIWFKVDRFYENVDLYKAGCWIQYRNALKEEYIARVIPRVIYNHSHDTLFIPWVISGPATKVSGDITFSFQFFRLGESEIEPTVYFNIHTKPATSKILPGLHVNPIDFIEGTPEDQILPESEILSDWWLDPSLNYQQSKFLEDYHILTEAYAELSAMKDGNLFWIELD